MLWSPALATICRCVNPRPVSSACCKSSRADITDSRAEASLDLLTVSYTESLPLPSSPSLRSFSLVRFERLEAPRHKYESFMWFRQVEVNDFVSLPNSELFRRRGFTELYRFKHHTYCFLLHTVFVLGVRNVYLFLSGPDKRKLHINTGIHAPTSTRLTPAFRVWWTTPTAPLVPSRTSLSIATTRPIRPVRLSSH
uniref:22 kDa protein n=1 Tax=Salmonella phage MB78 TaxID=52971 RepID=Q9AYY3_9CAUD|nr:22 kDa protein [Salmonella phage MB78]